MYKYLDKKSGGKNRHLEGFRIDKNRILKGILLKFLYEGVDWVYIILYRDCWQAFVNKAKKRRVQHIRFALETSLNYTRISSIEGFREQVKQRA